MAISIRDWMLATVVVGLVTALALLVSQGSGDATDNVVPANVGDGVVIEGDGTSALSVDGLTVELVDSNMGLCVHVVDGSGYSGGCGFDATDINVSWFVGSLGDRSFAAGVAPNDVKTAELSISDGYEYTAAVTNGVWLVGIDASALPEHAWPDSLEWRGAGGELVAVTD